MQCTAGHPVSLAQHKPAANIDNEVAQLLINPKLDLALGRKHLTVTWQHKGVSSVSPLLFEHWKKSKIDAEKIIKMVEHA